MGTFSSSGNGNASINATNSDDTITTDMGNDSIAGNDGNDTISSGGNNDTIDGGGGQDTIDGGEGEDTIQGGAGADSIDGGADNDTLYGGADNDSISGGTGDDTLRGGSGNDQMDGGDGNDTLLGGAGDDTIEGGAGEDTIEGGRGDDHMYAGNNSTTDTFIIREGHGNDVIYDFDPFEPDVIAFDMPEINSFADVQARMSQNGANTIIQYDNGEWVTLINVNMNDLSDTNFQYSAAPLCLHAGTMIATPSGERVIEDLREGALITTSTGPAPLRRLVRQSVTFAKGLDPVRPIMIRAHALGPDTPAHDLIVSPQHRIAVHDPAPQLIAACKLLHIRGVRRMNGRSTAAYYNLLFDTHQIIFANGCAVESLLATDHVQATLREALGPLPAMTPALPLTRSRH